MLGCRMPEPVQPIEAVESNGEDAAVELAKLRLAHNEVLAKRKRDKERIATLESDKNALQAKVTEAESALHEAQVGAPLKAMSESLSRVPELFLEQFSKHHKVEMVNGKLSLLTLDGKPVLDKDGKNVPFERQALTQYLTSGEDAKAKVFNAITLSLSRASGAGSTASVARVQTSKPEPTIQFGLR